MQTISNSPAKPLLSSVFQSKISNSPVQKMFDAYLSGDKAAAEKILADDFTFSSPLDSHVDRKQFWIKCWPGGKEVKNFHIIELRENEDEALLIYEMETKSGEKIKNVEISKIRGNQIKETQVFFGILPIDY